MSDQNVFVESFLDAAKNNKLAELYFKLKKGAEILQPLYDQSEYPYELKVGDDGRDRIFVGFQIEGQGYTKIVEVAQNSPDELLIETHASADYKKSNVDDVLAIVGEALEEASPPDVSCAVISSLNAKAVDALSEPVIDSVDLIYL